MLHQLVERENMTFVTRKLLFYYDVVKLFTVFNKQIIVIARITLYAYE